ncbi:hypothetical protein E7X23_26485, partial [Bacteroides fragilis]
VIAYKERLKDGYVMSQTFNTFNTFIYNEYQRTVGFNLRVGKTNLNVIAYKERLKDGYVMSQTFNTFNTFIYNEYQRT